MRLSSLLFSLFFVLLAVYSIVTLQDSKLSDAAIKFAIILLLSIGITSVVSIDSFAFTLYTIPVLITVIATHYGTAAISSYLSYISGISTSSGLNSIINLVMHDIVNNMGGSDPISIIGLALLNGVAEEGLFTGASFLILIKFAKAKYVAAFITSILFAIYHTQSYMGASPLFVLIELQKYADKIPLLLSPFATQMVKCGLSLQEAKLGGGLLGVSLGHAIGNGLLLLAAYGWV